MKVENFGYWFSFFIMYTAVLQILFFWVEEEGGSGEIRLKNNTLSGTVGDPSNGELKKKCDPSSIHKGSSGMAPGLTY